MKRPAISPGRITKCYLIFLMVFGVFLYYPSLTYTVIDGEDNIYFTNFGGYGFSENVFRIFTSDIMYRRGSLDSYYRPVANLYFFLMFCLCGKYPGGYFLGLLAIHLANTYLLYRYLYGLTGKRRIALVAATLFLAYSPGMAPFAMICSFMSPLALLLALGANLFYLRAVRTRTPWAKQAALLLFVLALHVKESVVLFFAVNFVVEYKLTGKIRKLMPLAYLGVVLLFIGETFFIVGLHGVLRMGEWLAGFTTISNIIFGSMLFPFFVGELPADIEIFFIYGGYIFVAYLCWYLISRRCWQYLLAFHLALVAPLVPLMFTIKARIFEPLFLSNIYGGSVFLALWVALVTDGIIERVKRYRFIRRLICGVLCTIAVVYAGFIILHNRTIFRFLHNTILVSCRPDIEVNRQRYILKYQPAWRANYGKVGHYGVWHHEWDSESLGDKTLVLVSPDDFHATLMPAIDYRREVWAEYYPRLRRDLAAVKRGERFDCNLLLSPLGYSLLKEEIVSDDELLEDLCISTALLSRELGNEVYRERFLSRLVELEKLTMSDQTILRKAIDVLYRLEPAADEELLRAACWHLLSHRDDMEIVNDDVRRIIHRLIISGDRRAVNLVTRNNFELREYWFLRVLLEKNGMLAIPAEAKQFWRHPLDWLYYQRAGFWVANRERLSY